MSNKVRAGADIVKKKICQRLTFSKDRKIAVCVGGIDTDKGCFHRVALLIAMTFYLLALIKNTKCVITNGAFSLLNYLAAIKALPPFKVDEVVKKCL
jgi:hypothetical protein